MPAGYFYDLEHILAGQLEEPGIRGVVLEALNTGDLTGGPVQAGVTDWAPTGVIEQVEGVRAELEVLRAPGMEVLEQGHIHALISRTVDLVLLCACI